MDEEGSVSHASRLNQNPERQALIEALAKRFYVNERGTFVSNGLSTGFILFPSDLEPGNKKHLERKIQDAILYAAKFFDVEEINTLLYIPSADPDKDRVNPNQDLTLGLYLYFADECSRLKKPITFLTAMRQAGASLESGKSFYRADLLEKTMQALKILGIDDETHTKILQEWSEHTRYTINGVTHYCDDKGQLHGAYATLAQAMREKDTIALNHAISYAIGNDNFMQGLGAKEAFEFTDNVANSIKNNGYSRHMDHCIAKGDNERTMTIKKAVEDIKPKIMGSLPEGGGNPSVSALKAHHDLAIAIFSKLPDSALEIVYREVFNCAYADGNSIARCYPLERPAGLSEKDHKSAPASKGIMQKRYRTLYISNGIRPYDPAFDAGLELRSNILAQTLMHEITHLATSSEHLHDNEYRVLQKAVEDVHNEIVALKKAKELPEYFSKRVMTMRVFNSLYEENLENILDYQSRFYEKYKSTDVVIDKKKKMDEVICNLAGFMYSEFTYPAGESATVNPYADVPSIKVLADKINKLLIIARNRSRKEYNYLEMPGASLGASKAAG